MACSTSSSVPKELIPPHELFLRYFMSKSTDLTDGEVKDACNSYSEKSLEIISTDEKDTVLHIASRLKKKQLVLDLLDIVPEDYRNHRLAGVKNQRGNNVLHEVAVSDSMKEVAKKMLERAPSLITGRNELGETPIFCAARYGQLEMFEFLAEKMKEKEQTAADRIDYLRREDGTTALHISIYTECFELASHIAESYPELIREKDPDSMTALQHLACNPTAFQKYKKKPRKESMQELMGSAQPTPKFQITEPPTDIVSLYKQMEQALEGIVEQVRSKSADKSKKWLQKLVELLVKEDISWHTGVNLQEAAEEENHRVKAPDKEQDDPNTSTHYKKYYKKSEVSPLLLATISNIEDIVEEIIKQHPEALGCTNKEGQNILHLAILYGNVDIFKMVIQAEIFMSSLSSAVDCKGNSILHMVGSRERSTESSEKMKSPAFQLRNELKLFQEVKSAFKTHLTKRLNCDNQTAEELFAAKNEKLHGEAKEWLLRTTENCTILSVFIATVAFAAAYTVPGGPDQNTGIPILCSKPFFLIFIIADVISLTLALTSVGIFLSILTSSFALQDFETILFRKLRRGMITMILSISMMAVAFGATIVLIWKDAAWTVVGFLPVPIFFLSYSPLRSAAMEWFKSLPVKFLAGVLVIIIVVVLYLFIVPWILFMVCSSIFCREKSGAKSDTQAPNQTPTDPAPV